MSRQMRMRGAMWALAAVLFLPAAVLAQPVPIFRAGVDLIEVDVNVVDEDGNPVADLDGSEFVVSVDGEPRSVASAQFIDLRGTGPEPLGSETPLVDRFHSTNTTAARGRVIMIAVDRENIDFGEGRRVMQAASAFLDALGPNDKVAFVTVPPPGPYIGFTSDHRLVQDALEDTVGIGNEIKFFAEQFRLGVAEALEISRSQGRSALAFVAIRRFCDDAEVGDECQNEVIGYADLVTNEVQRQAKASVTMLETLLERLGEIEGPKSLIWISQGLITETGVELGRLVSRASAARTSVNVVMIDDFANLNMSQEGSGPTPSLDRNMAEMGLHAVASFTGGTLHRVIRHAAPAFARIQRELSGYYLLGVEPRPEDLDGNFHTIDVAVQRDGAHVRAHREFRHQPVDEISTNIEDRVRRTLSSPIAVSDLPLRVATYTYRDPASENARLLVVTDVERDVYGPADLAFGYQLVRPDGDVVASGGQRATLDPVAGPQGPVIEQLAVFIVEPGQYTLKLAVVEDGGRRGSLEHPVDTRLLSGERFAMGDLVLATAPTDATASVRPPVETRVTDDRLLAYLELYADDPGDLRDVQVQIEVDGDTLGETLIADVGSPRGSGAGPAQVVSAVIPVDGLPPGPYVAQAVVTRADAELGRRTRHFEIVRESEQLAADADLPEAAPVAMTTVDLGSAAALTMMLPEPPAFRRDSVLAPDVIDFFLDALDRRFPVLAEKTAGLRRGAINGVANLQLGEGGASAAALLRGLAFFSEGDLDRAGEQFAVALRTEPDFWPASFYLGAVHAARGRDAAAVGAWRRALLAGDALPVAYAVLSDALLRLGNASQAVPLLSEALAHFPNDDALRRRLTMALAVAGLYGAALETVEPYLDRHPSDHEVLLVAVHALYAQHAIAGLAMTSQDQARMAEYAEAYAMSGGPNAAIVSTWAASIAAAP